MNQASSDKPATREAREVEGNVIEALESLLDELPFRELTVDDVAKEAGLPLATFYRYFHDLDSVILRGLGTFSDEVIESSIIWFDDSSDPHTALQNSAALLVAAFHRHASLLSAIAGTPLFEEAWRLLIDGFIEPNVKRIERLNHEGVSSVEFPRETARALIWMLESYLFEAFGRTSDVNPEVALKVVVEIWRRVLLPGTG